jgi:hypothetical protein
VCLLVSLLLPLYVGCLTPGSLCRNISLLQLGTHLFSAGRPTAAHQDPESPNGCSNLEREGRSRGNDQALQSTRSRIANKGIARMESKHKEPKAPRTALAGMTKHKLSQARLCLSRALLMIRRCCVPFGFLLCFLPLPPFPLSRLFVTPKHEVLLVASRAEMLQHACHAHARTLPNPDEPFFFVGLSQAIAALVLATCVEGL